MWSQEGVCREEAKIGSMVIIGVREKGGRGSDVRDKEWENDTNLRWTSKELPHGKYSTS